MKEKELKIFIREVKNKWSKNQKEDLIIPSPVCSLDSEASEEEVHYWVEENKKWNDNVILTCLDKIHSTLCSSNLRTEEQLFKLLKNFKDDFAQVRNKDIGEAKLKKRQREEQREREEGEKKKKKKKKEKEEKEKEKEKGRRRRLL
jgi:hypothetical protein